ncbi:MAG: cytochrome D1 domain-containing protein [Gammaproteobacteria bacterium]
MVLAAAAATAPGVNANGCGETRGTGDLGIVVERARGSVQLLNTTTLEWTGRIEGLGDLSHASAVYSRDARYAYVFGRDGGLTKVDLLCQRIAARRVQAGNSIGGAVSQDGRLVAVSNYKPGGVRIFDAHSLELVHDIPAIPTGDSSDANGGANNAAASKVVGLVDAPGDRFVFSLYDTGEIWVVEVKPGAEPAIQRFSNVGKQPYDGLITPDGRYYIAGLFGEDGLALLDLWHPERGVRRILDGYGRGEESLPVYKMPHLEGWAVAGGYAFLPAVGRHEVLAVDLRTFTEHARIPVQGQPVFVMAHPHGRTLWVNFALPDNDTIQIIDTETLTVVETLKPGKAVLHMEFTPRGEHVWMSVRDEDRIDIYDTRTRARLASLDADKPSGIFFSARAHKLGL